MPSTFSKLKAYAQRSLGNASTETDVSHALIVNSAGRHLYNMRDWFFRMRPEVSAPFVANQPYVVLPPDVGKLMDPTLNGLTQDIQWCTPAKLLSLRDHAITPPGFRYWCALVQPPQSTQFEPLPSIQLEIFPTPTAAQDNLRFWYWARWRELTDDNHYPAVDEAVEPLLIELIQAFAEGWIKDEFPTPTARLRAIEEGPIFKNARREDSDRQMSMGPLEGGAVLGRDGYGLGYLPYTNPTIT